MRMKLKKSLSLLLTVVMLFSMFPTAAFADGDDGSSSGSGNTVVLPTLAAPENNDDAGSKTINVAVDGTVSVVGTTGKDGTSLENGWENSDSSVVELSWGGDNWHTVTAKGLKDGTVTLTHHYTDNNGAAQSETFTVVVGTGEADEAGDETPVENEFTVVITANVGAAVTLSPDKTAGSVSYTYADKGGYALRAGTDNVTVDDYTVTVTWDKDDADLTTVKASVVCEEKEENYTGDIDTETVVPEDQVEITVKCSTDEGVVIYTPHVEQAEKKDGSFTYELTIEPGYTVALGEVTGGSASLSGNTLTVTWDTENAAKIEVPVIYTPAQVEYTVTHVYAGLDGAEPETETETLTGKVGELTEAEARGKEGFTDNDFDQKVIAYDGDNNITIPYSRNEYKVSYNSLGGSYVPNQGRLR